MGYGRQFNRNVGKKRVLVENVIGMLQEWKNLLHKWKGKTRNTGLYKRVFFSCAQLTNLQRIESPKLP